MGDGSIPSAFFSLPGHLFHPEVTLCHPGTPFPAGTTAPTKLSMCSWVPSPMSVTPSPRLLSPPGPHGRAFTQPSPHASSALSPLTSLSCPQSRATVATRAPGDRAEAPWGPTAASAKGLCRGGGTCGAGAARQRAMLPEPGGQRGPGGLSSSWARRGWRHRLACAHTERAGPERCQHRRGWVPAPDTWRTRKRLPSTIPRGFLQLAQGRASCGSGSMFLGVAAAPNPRSQGDSSPRRLLPSSPPSLNAKYCVNAQSRENCSSRAA